MTSNQPHALSSVSDDEEDDVALSEEELNQQNNLAINKKTELGTTLYKWTNYIHGWQERYVILKDGVLSYYKNSTETQYGCRGAIALKEAIIFPHELDDCRFDIRLNDSVWYLRAETPELREQWLDIIKEQHGDYPTKLTRTGSLRSNTFSTASISRISATSYKRGTGLKAKLAEMETFKDILARQIETLQVYFDACANSVSKRFEPYNATPDRANDNDEIDNDTYSNEKFTNQRNVNDHTLNEIHGAMGVDFKGEAFTFKSTTSGVLYNLAHCIELMQQREEFWEKKLAHEVDKRKRIEEQLKEMSSSLSNGKKITPILTGPDFEEGPHSTIKEDQFFDAIDSTLDTLEQEEERRVQAYESLANIPVLKKQVNKHRLSDEIERVVQDHIKYDIIDDFQSNVWELLASDGEMKVYRRELEENGIVIDPLKAVHTVRGITGFELCKYFWDPVVRMEWEGTLETSRMIEALSDDTLIFHQVVKKVWPAAQRDSCFWSHIRAVDRQDPDNPYPDWIVVNYSTNHELAPLKEPLIRATANIAMTCTTILADKSKLKNPSKITRNDLICKINYVSHVNPGGWAPANALRAVYKHVYPKFVKRFTEYVIDKTAKKDILFEFE